MLSRQEVVPISVILPGISLGMLGMRMLGGSPSITGITLLHELPIFLTQAHSQDMRGVIRSDGFLFLLVLFLLQKVSPVF